MAKSLHEHAPAIACGLAAFAQCIQRQHAQGVEHIGTAEPEREGMLFEQIHAACSVAGEGENPLTSHKKALYTTSKHGPAQFGGSMSFSDEIHRQEAQRIEDIAQFEPERESVLVEQVHAAYAIAVCFAEGIGLGKVCLGMPGTRDMETTQNLTAKGMYPQQKVCFFSALPWRRSPNTYGLIEVPCLAEPDGIEKQGDGRCRVE